MGSPAEMARCYDMVTTENAAIMGLHDIGVGKGKRASLLVLDAGTKVEAIRLRAERRLVISNGRIIARRDANPARMSLEGRTTTTVDRRFVRSV
jgi:cytosine deaminase